MADKPKLDMEIQPDRSALFNGRDANIKIRVAFESPTQVRVEMWRETATTFERLAPDIGNIGSQSFRDKLLKAAQEAFNPPPGNDEQKAVDTIPHLKDDLDLVAAQLGIPEIS